MTKGFEKDLNGHQPIISLKQKAKQLRGKGLDNGVKACPYTRRNEREDELKHKIRSAVSVIEEVKRFKEEGFDKENNNREDKHQRYERKSRVYHKNYDQKYINGHNRHQSDDGIEAGERSTVRLKEKAKQLRDTGSHTPKVEHQNGRIRHETNDEKVSGDEVIARLKEKAKQLKDTGSHTPKVEHQNGRKRHETNDEKASGDEVIARLKEKAKQLKGTGSHTPKVEHQNGRIRHETNDEKASGDDVIARLKEKAKQRRGRGFGNETNNREGVHRILPSRACAEDDNAKAASDPQRSADGWILFVKNISDEADEDDIQDKFCDYGPIMNISMNVDRRTGFCKGYALVLFETYEDALSAKDALDGAEIMGQPIKVDWCFIRGDQRVQKRSH